VDKLVEHLPEIIAAAAQSHLGILALLSVALSVLAYFFFAGASEKVKVGIFVLLFLGVVGFGTAMFRAAANAPDVAQPRLATDKSPPPDPNPVASLSKEAKLLLKEAASDPAGIVMFTHYGGGVDLQTNGKNLITDQSRRAVAVWESAPKRKRFMGHLTSWMSGQLLRELQLAATNAGKPFCGDGPQNKIQFGCNIH
jgi:hypothetical protein